ncbi:MAG TPA: diaminopimelate epimerase [Selenomonadales bacterium]|nr:diaminopimelate epimerase [Selenomonadales bacterium]
MDFHFYKYHALGNDYLVVDPAKVNFVLDAETIKRVCHRHYGVGSDGILYGPLTAPDAISLRIFNPDGSEAEKSGNGIRIFSRYLFDAGYVTTSPFTLTTPGGCVRVELLDAKASRLRVDMGTATFRSDLIPVNGKPREVIDEPIRVGDQQFNVTCLSVGNPHCVLPLADISPDLAKRLGPLIENHPLFPNRINVQFLQAIDNHNIRIEIWERGAGYTLASGSSSSAAAYAAHRLGFVGRQVNVHMPGGIIAIDITPDRHIHMTGPVTKVAEGFFADELKAVDDGRGSTPD